MYLSVLIQRSENNTSVW